MSFFPIALAGFLLNSLAILVDKVQVERNIPHPIAYAFYISTFGLAALLLIPFGFNFLPLQTLVLAALSGISFTCALIFFYQSLILDETSRVAPIVATVNAITTLLLGWILFGQKLPSMVLLSSIILIAGLIILTSTTWFKSRVHRHHLLYMLGAGIAFSLSALFLREVFLQTTFINGMIWSRIFAALFAWTFLLHPKTRQHIQNSKLTKHHFANKASYLLVVGQTMGAIANLLITFSISLVNPAVVNAMQGSQFVFIFLIVLFAGKKLRHLLDEDLNKRVLGQKILGGFCIVVGLALLALNT